MQTFHLLCMIDFDSHTVCNANMYHTFRGPHLLATERTYREDVSTVRELPPPSCVDGGEVALPRIVGFVGEYWEALAGPVADPQKGMREIEDQ